MKDAQLNTAPTAFDIAREVAQNATGTVRQTLRSATVEQLRALVAAAVPSVSACALVWMGKPQDDLPFEAHTEVQKRRAKLITDATNLLAAAIVGSWFAE